MKRLFLIIAILLCANSLKSQTSEYKSFVLNNLDYDTAKDSIIVTSPLFKGTVIIYPFIIQPEPPTHFEIILEIPIDQIKKKSSPRRDLKAQISQLIAITLVMCLFWRFP